MTKRLREEINDELQGLKKLVASNAEDYTAMAARVTRLENEQRKNKLVFAKLARFSRIMKKRVVRLEEKYLETDKEIKSWGLKLLSDTAGSCEVTLQAQADASQTEFNQCDFLSEEEVSQLKHCEARQQTGYQELGFTTQK